MTEQQLNTSPLFNLSAKCIGLIVAIHFVLCTLIPIIYFSKNKCIIILNNIVKNYIKIFLIITLFIIIYDMVYLNYLTYDFIIILCFTIWTGIIVLFIYKYLLKNKKKKNRKS